jgi:hypothetical protein
MLPNLIILNVIILYYKNFNTIFEEGDFFEG